MDETKAEAVTTGAEEVSWNLADLYQAGDDPALEQDFAAVEKAASEFAGRYRGRVAGLDAGQMAALLRDYEQIEETGGKIGSYAYLSWSANTEDPAGGALLQRATEFGSRVSQQMVFFTLEWANAPDEAANALLADPSLAR